MEYLFQAQSKNVKEKAQWLLYTQQTENEHDK